MYANNEHFCFQHTNTVSHCLSDCVTVISITHKIGILFNAQYACDQLIIRNACLLLILWL